MALFSDVDGDSGDVFSLALTFATHNPSLLILREKGYELAIHPDPDGGASTFIATAPGRRFAATTGVELLGLVTLWEHFGTDWNRPNPNLLDELMKEEE